MRLTLLICCCTLLSLSASAQFWKKKEIRYPQLEDASFISKTTITNTTVTLRPDVRPVTIPGPVYSLDIAEQMIIKEAKHHMRYREYADASYSFVDLAHLYVIAHRFSEAQWFLLQSNNITRQQHNDKLTITNLMDLATIKASIGELALARTDLKEAHSLALSTGLNESLKQVDEKTRQIELQNTVGFTRAGLRYAAAVEAENSSKK